MKLNKSQIREFLAWTFGKLKGSPYVQWVERWVPQTATVIDLLEARADQEMEALASPLPETFTPSQLITVLFSLAEGWMPQYAQQLEAVKMMVLMVLAFLPPSVMLAVAVPTSIGELRTYLDMVENRVINAGWAASAWIGPTDKKVAQGLKIHFQQRTDAVMGELLAVIPRD